jgi:hypothetical protein
MGSKNKIESITLNCIRNNGNNSSIYLNINFQIGEGGNYHDTNGHLTTVFEGFELRPLRIEGQALTTELTSHKNSCCQLITRK